MQAGALILPKRVQFKDTILHTDVKLSEKAVSYVFVKGISNDGQRILLVLNYFVQLGQVANLVDAAIFPRKNEGGTYSSALLLRK